MKSLRAASALVAVMILAAGCSDAAVTGPVAERRASLVGGDPVLEMIRWTTPRSHAAQASQRVGILGGVISAGGVTLVVPPLALSKSTTITLTVPAGEYVQADLQPHGLQFRGEPQLLFPLLGTDAGLVNLNLVGVYTEHEPVDGQIRVTEQFETKVLGLSLGFGIRHFSKYAPARGGLILIGG